LQLRFKSVLAFFDGLKSFQKSHEVWMLLIRHGLDLHERATAGSSDKAQVEAQGAGPSFFENAFGDCHPSSGGRQQICLFKHFSQQRPLHSDFKSGYGGI
jgi:hypothetical protein